MIGGRAIVGDGRFTENIMHFARLLRMAGFKTGQAATLEAIMAIQAIGVGRRDDFYWALHAVFVSHPDQRTLFDQAFRLFWRNPELPEKMMGLLLSTMKVPTLEERATIARRLAEAMASVTHDKSLPPSERKLEIDAALTWSAQESLRCRDFEQMSAEEEREALAAIATMRLNLKPGQSRRKRMVRHGSTMDLRAMMRSGSRGNPDLPMLRFSTLRLRNPSFVVICDISGSMSRYARILLHFMHAMTRELSSVHSFVFGSGLTNITRALRRRDVDEALALTGLLVKDWSGGTRIGACLGEFNRVWRRRVGAGPIVLLMSDGLDRSDAIQLAQEAARLRRSARRLIWLNPLLRYDAYSPRSLGARAILPNVDEVRPVHNLDSLTALANALGERKSGDAFLTLLRARLKGR